jgi:hypothetical protein
MVVSDQKGVEVGGCAVKKNCRLRKNGGEKKENMMSKCCIIRTNARLEAARVGQIDVSGWGFWLAGHVLVALSSPHGDYIIADR